MTRQTMFQAKKESQPLKTSSLFRRQAAQAPAAEQETAFPPIHLGQDHSAIPFKPVHPAPALGPSSISCPFTPQRCPFGGACHACPPKMQAKLKIGQPGDKYEQEADRVAEQVMRMPEPQVQRKCSAPGCKDEEEKKLLQTKPASAGEAGAQVDHPLIQNVLSSPGQPLDAGTRSFMEPRFGQDFSEVRVHVGGQAAESARAVNARAYTVGRDVVFGEGQYAPGSDEGKRLVAHELAHVMQKEGGHYIVRRAVERCSSKTDENNIVVSHTVPSNNIKNPGDKANITLQFGCKPRSFKSEIVDSKGTEIKSTYITIWNKEHNLNEKGEWITSWDGKRYSKEIGTFMVDDGDYKHHIKEVAYATGANGDKIAKKGGILSISPKIAISVRTGVNPEKHLKDEKGTLLHDNIDNLATAIRSEAEGYSDKEKMAIAWAIRNEMIRINSYSVQKAKDEFNFDTQKKGSDAEKILAKEVLSKDMSNDPTNGAIKWYSPKSMPPNNGECKDKGGKYDCSGGTIPLNDGSNKSSMSPGFCKKMTFINIVGVNQWNFRFYKL